MNRRRPSLMSLVALGIILFPLLYVLRYAPAVRWRRSQFPDSREPVTGQTVFVPWLIDGDTLPPYRPVDWLIDNTPMRGPLFSWADQWGVRDEFEGARALRTHSLAHASSPDAAVTGIVTMDGEPLANAEVGFHTPNWGSVAMTNDSGEFSLSVPPRSYTVTISKITAPYTVEGGAIGEHPTEMGTETIPERYSDGLGSILSCTVIPGRNATSFALHSRPGDSPTRVPVQ